MLLIFDWDGTLCDSADKIVESMQLAARECSLEILPPKQIENIIGLGLSEAILKLYPSLVLTEVDELKVSYSKHFVEVDKKTPSVLFDQAKAVLLQLRERGYKLAVATGKSRRGLNRVLESFSLQDFFDATRCADETQSKPHPQMLNELLAELDVNVEHAVMIGDSSYDMAMAQHIAMPRVAVSFGVHEPELLDSFSPMQVIDHLQELLLLFPCLMEEV